MPLPTTDSAQQKSRCNERDGHSLVVGPEKILCTSKCQNQLPSNIKIFFYFYADIGLKARGEFASFHNVINRWWERTLPESRKDWEVPDLSLIGERLRAGERLPQPLLYERSGHYGRILL